MVLQKRCWYRAGKRLAQQSQADDSCAGCCCNNLCLITHHYQEITTCSRHQLVEYNLRSNNLRPTSVVRSEQVREEGPLEVCLVEDEAHKANHGNAAQRHLKLQQGWGGVEREQEQGAGRGRDSISSIICLTNIAAICSNSRACCHCQAA
jgi:hypothetical protein